MNAQDIRSWIHEYIISKKGLFESTPRFWENRPESAPATSISRPSPHGMSWNCLSDLWSFFGDGPGTDLKMFPPVAHSPQGTPAVQTTHFQFHSHQINLVLTYRKGLNTGLTPGQMPLASKQPGVGPQKSLPLAWEKATNLKWHLHIQSSSCINVNLMSTNKRYQSATTARCYRALPALCKCAPTLSLLPNCLSWRSLSVQSAWNHQSQCTGWRGKTKCHKKIELNGIKQYKKLKLASMVFKYITFTQVLYWFHWLKWSLKEMTSLPPPPSFIHISIHSTNIDIYRCSIRSKALWRVPFPSQ